MYNAYFGFHESPFSVTPSPHFFYANSYYEEAYATLLYAIRERKGLVVLSGEVGTGKTTVLRKLMDGLLDERVRFVFFYNTNLTFEELLTFMCDELGVQIKSDQRLHKIQALNAFLIAQLQQGGSVVLLIDEAQNLADEALENLRLLLNLETESEKLLQIVLVGQPELEAKLAQPGLRQLKQRIALRSRLYQLKEWEVWPFIRCRLQAVGCKREDLFTPEALRLIARYSQGTPRLINIICDNALLIAYGTSQKTVSATLIEEVAVDLRLNPEVRGVPSERQQEGTELPPNPAPFAKQEQTEHMPVVVAPRQVPFIPTPYIVEEPDPPPKRAERAHLAWAVVFFAVLSVAGWGIASFPFPEKERLASISKQIGSTLTGGNTQDKDSSLGPTAAVPVVQEQPPPPQQAQPVPVNVPPPAAPQAGLRSQEAVVAVQTSSPKDLPPNDPPPLVQPSPAKPAPRVVVAPLQKSQSEPAKPMLPSPFAEVPPPMLAAVKRTSLEKAKPSPLVPPAKIEEPKAEKPKAKEQEPESVQLLADSPPIPISAEVQGKSVTVPNGFTVYSLAKKVYQTPNAILGIDLLNESNPAVGDMDRPVAGEKLWIPPLDQRTLLRQQPDGSYHLILTSFRSMEDAEDYARLVIHERGYETVITPRRVSDSHLLYRVAIIGLSSVEQAQQVWKIFSPSSILAQVPATERKETTDEGLLSPREADENSSGSSEEQPLEEGESSSAGAVEGISPDL